MLLTIANGGGGGNVDGGIVWQDARRGFSATQPRIDTCPDDHAPIE